ncbi:proton-conducting transporter membrane subunit [Sedimentitalea sp. JM2-8]|uniref:Proton-conducting transporter membrane subunit n=1 Tax=Sedimentitalea xiamensis TaxID=3050037 RepID=A0ABT7FCP5_9RHOB|nr:proton-conducting transporter membrane subunit [Sedimentitalea xiamensis]MDK3072893.1 proton-conducting transporter membrane subunit [Sedimentitalea xiamensis]
MSALHLHPLGIYLFGLGGGFLLPILYQVGKRWLHAGFVVAMLGMTLCAVVPALSVLQSGETIEITTAGALPPVSINLRFGPWEAAVSASATLAAAMLAISFWQTIRTKYVPLLLFLIATMGVNGLIQTRDLFNLFVFLEILSVGTYGLLALSTSRAGVQAAFKYITATMVASALVLLGAVLLYKATGHLNIDLLIEAAPPLAAPIAGTALAMVLAGFLIEMKPYPAGGWGLDVYETAPPPLAAFLSVVGSAGLIFALGKLLPLYDQALGLLTVGAALTFLASNLAGLRQQNVFRLLGYSSIGQMALLLIALAVLTDIGANEVAPYVLFGLFVNHLLAKAGLFCLAGALRARRVDQPLSLAAKPALALLLGVFVVAIAGLPPFPGFWAKWELILQLAEAQRPVLIGVILIGSLFEAAYLFRWFFRALGPAEKSESEEADDALTLQDVLPPVGFAIFLAIGGAAGAMASGALTISTVLPLLAGAALLLAEPLPGRIKAVAMLAIVAAGSLLLPRPEGIAGLFGPVLLAGGLVIAFAGMAWPGPRRGHYPWVAVLLLSIQSLLAAPTGLAFYTAWEFVTLASAFLIARREAARGEALRFLIFSLAAAFCLMAGFAMIAADAGTRSIYAIIALGSGDGLGVALLVTGFLIKAAAIGVHVWQPGAYAEATDDVTALLSAVVSKAAIFGLLLTGYLVLRSQMEVEFGRTLAWIGMATTIAGALLALRQAETKRLLAYSSMSQLGYIVTAIGLMGHLGWVTALYLVASHMLVKGILFLAVAGVAHRTGSSLLADAGGLLRAMPVTAAMVAVALLSMSGLPPLMGFGSKWLLLAAMMEKGWAELAIAGAIATFLGLWYMVRLFTALFLGPPAAGGARGEASPALLLPQVLLVGGILVLSFFPKLLMEPVSAAIDPEFAATLVWQGQSLETIYGLWDPTPMMLSALVAVAVLTLLWWTAVRDRRVVPTARAALVSASPLPPALMPPLAITFWRGVTAGTNRVADTVRRIYTGNAQTYVLLTLLYFLAVAVALPLIPAR